MKLSAFAKFFVFTAGTFVGAILIEADGKADETKTETDRSSNFDKLSDMHRRLQRSQNIDSGPRIEVDSGSYRKKTDIPALAGHVAANAADILRGDVASVGSSLLDDENAKRFTDGLYLDGYPRIAGRVAGTADLLNGPIPIISGLNGREFEKQVRKTLPWLDKRSNIRRLLDEQNVDVYDTKSYRAYLTNPSKLNETKLAIELSEIALEKKRKRGFYESNILEGESAFLSNPEVNADLEQLHRELQDLEEQKHDQPSRIPYQSGQGIKCGPISASERRQLDAGSDGYYSRQLDSIKWDEHYLAQTGDSRATSTDPITGERLTSRQFKQKMLNQKKANLRQKLVKLRNSNGYCPAPIGESPSSPPHSGSQASNAQPAANPQKDTGNSSGNELPPGYSQIRPGACRSSAGDVFRC
jgi:hypothetical protein